MFQGSSDRNSTFINVYEEHLQRLISDTREYLNRPTLPWLQVVSPTWSPGNSVNVQLQSIQRSVVADFENAVFVESDNPMRIPLVLRMALIQILQDLRELEWLLRINGSMFFRLI